MSVSTLTRKTAPLLLPLRLICTDFDGTLAEAEADVPITAAFFEHLVAWRKAGPLYWIINTGRTYDSLHEELCRRNAPIWPDWVVTVEREIWLIKDRRPIGWFEWNRKCELLHAQLFASVKPLWNIIESYIRHETKATLIEDVGSPLGIIASSDEEAEKISAYIDPLLRGWSSLMPVRNSVYFRFSHKLYNKGTCLDAIASGLGVQPYEVLAIGDHLNDLPMLDRRYARHLACPSNAVNPVKARIRTHGGYVATKAVGHGTVEAWDYFFPIPGEPVNAKHLLQTGRLLTS